MMKQNETQTWKAFEKEQLKEECQFISTVLVAQTKNGIYRSNLTLKIFKMNWLQKILVSENIKDGYYCDPGKKDLKNSWAGIGKTNYIDFLFCKIDYPHENFGFENYWNHTLQISRK